MSIDELRDDEVNNEIERLRARCAKLEDDNATLRAMVYDLQGLLVTERAKGSP